MRERTNAIGVSKMVSLERKLTAISKKYCEQSMTAESNIEVKQEAQYLKVLKPLLIEVSLLYPKRKIEYYSGMGISSIQIESKSIDTNCLARYAISLPIDKDFCICDYHEVKNFGWVEKNIDHPLVKLSMFLYHATSVRGYAADLGRFIYLNGVLIVSGWSK